MIHSGFRSFVNLSFINQFLKKWDRLTSTASNRKVAETQHDISWFYQKLFFQKIKIKIKFKTLDDSGVLGRDFSGFRSSVASITSTASKTSVVSMTSTASFHRKIYWSLCLDHRWHPNYQYWSLYVDWIVKNQIFHR